jgi:hypothetical protein
MASWRPLLRYLSRWWGGSAAGLGRPARAPVLMTRRQSRLRSSLRATDRSAHGRRWAVPLAAYGQILVAAHIGGLNPSVNHSPYPRQGTSSPIVTTRSATWPFRPPGASAGCRTRHTSGVGRLPQIGSASRSAAAIPSGCRTAVGIFDRWRVHGHPASRAHGRCQGAGPRSLLAWHQGRG